jgi:hypothetical protein
MSEMARFTIQEIAFRSRLVHQPLFSHKHFNGRLDEFLDTFQQFTLSKLSAAGEPVAIVARGLRKV